jgi:formyltetrahydrofolate synthetase
MYQVCVREEVMWNVTEHWVDGINGKMQLIKQLQNTANYQFLYDIIKDWRTEVENPVETNIYIPENTGLKF